MCMKLYELEQQILQCWNVVDDIDRLYRFVLDRDMSKDDIANVLVGIKMIYSMKFEETFETFENAVKESFEERQK